MRCDRTNIALSLRCILLIIIQRERNKLYSPLSLYPYLFYTKLDSTQPNIVEFSPEFKWTGIRDKHLVLRAG